MRPRADAGGRSFALRSPGDARGATGASEVRRLDGPRRRKRSGTFGRLTEASRFGVNRRLPTAWANAVRRAPRFGAIVFENSIRELQTSVERTGVAAGTHPRVPVVPADALGAPRGEAA